MSQETEWGYKGKINDDYVPLPPPSYKLVEKIVHGQIVHVKCYETRYTRSNAKEACPRQSGTQLSWEHVMGGRIVTQATGALQDKRAIKVDICSDYNEGMSVEDLAAKWNKSLDYIRNACGLTPRGLTK